MLALGLISWLFSRAPERTLDYLDRKFASKPTIRDANAAAFRAGYALGETLEGVAVRYEVPPAPAKPGTYRQISGNKALALGLMAAAAKADLDLFLGAYPITPATDILNELSAVKDQGVMTFQAEDEIAAIGAAIGASYAGQLGVTSTSGPGMSLKAEMIGLAVMLELPLVIVDVQRAGPSTGMPTRTEQSDLNLALHGRHGEAPLPVIAASSPGDCFHAAYEAARIAVEHRTPVILLSDGYLGNGAEPWLVPDLATLPAIEPTFATASDLVNGTFLPYRRDAKGARPWAIPGTAGLEHRIGGLEKADLTGAVSNDPDNHERMIALRQAKVDAVAVPEKADLTGAVSNDPDNHERMIALRQAKVDAVAVPDLVVKDPDADADVLVVGWGSTWGPIDAAARRVRAAGGKVATAHLTHLNPLPANTGEVLRRYRRVIVAEMNTGQLLTVLRARYLVDAQPYTWVKGQPISPSRFSAHLLTVIAEEAS